MKNTYLFFFMLLIFAGCSTKNESEVVFESTELNDSIKTARLDSIYSDLSKLNNESGVVLLHKTYDIGIFRNCKFEVHRMSILNSPRSFIVGNIVINYEDAYYYYTESGMISKEEIEPLLEGIKNIRDYSVDRKEDTETRLVVKTHDKLRIMAEYKNEKWKYRFHVNYLKSDAGLTFQVNQFDELISLYGKMLEKIEELESDELNNMGL